MKLYVIVLGAMLLTACNASKKITYFQDADFLDGTPAPVVQDILLDIGDKVQFSVNVQSEPLLSQLFRYSSSNSGNGYSNEQMNYFIVDEDGNITLPVVGKIQARGLRRSELEQKLKEGIIAQGYGDKVTVTSTLMNAGYTVIGEVNKPGRYPIYRDNVTVLEALADGKDLTINGRRDNVVVVRKVNGVDKVYQMDLRSLSDVLSSPAYYLQNNDVVYVQPTDKRAREAVNFGNDIYKTSFWLSLTNLEIQVINLINHLND